MLREKQRGDEEPRRRRKAEVVQRGRRNRVCRANRGVYGALNFCFACNLGPMLSDRSCLDGGKMNVR